MKSKLRAPATPEYLRSSARRAADQVVKYGWRPRQCDLAELRASTADGRAYRELMRAWRIAGFRTIAIMRLAGRGQ